MVLEAKIMKSENISAGNWNLKKIFTVLISYNNSLSNEGILRTIREGLCRVNFVRDLVDTLCHVSRGSATTGPNNITFLLYGKGAMGKTGHGWFMASSVCWVLSVATLCLGVSK